MKALMAIRKSKYALVSIAISLALILPFVPTASAAGISVYLNGRLLSYQDLPQTTNSVILIPFMSTCYEMGADVDWDPESSVATAMLGNKYAAIQVGNTTFTYGEYSYDQSGFKKNTENHSVLDSYPVAKYSDILVPVKVFSDGLGASATTDTAKNTVYIISPTVSPKPTPLPTQSPQPTLIPTNPAFDYTPLFEVVSSQKAQSMYNLNEKFVMVYFRSDDSNSINLMPTIKQTAQELGKKIYAVDFADKYNNTNSFNKLDFIWQFISTTEITLPTVFFVNGKGSVTYYKLPIDKPTLGQRMLTFWNTAQPVTTPSPTINPAAIPTPSPRPTPRPTFATPTPTPILNENARWQVTTIANAQSMYTTKKAFVLVLYHSMDTDSIEKLSNIKVAATISNTIIYGIDMAYATFSENWFGKNLVNQNMLYPTVLYVSSNGVITSETQPTNVQQLAVKYQGCK